MQGNDVERKGSKGRWEGGRGTALGVKIILEYRESWHIKEIEQK